MGGVDFEDWYARTHPRLVSTLTLISGDADAATEAADESFVRAFERWSRVSLMTSPTGWTYRTALNALRRRRRRAAMEQRLLRRTGLADVEPPTDWSVETWNILQQLPARERTAVALRYVADLTTEEIAAAMGIASGTVGSTLSAARSRLEHLLREMPYDEEGGAMKERTGA